MANHPNSGRVKITQALIDAGKSPAEVLAASPLSGASILQYSYAKALTTTYEFRSELNALIRGTASRPWVPPGPPEPPQPISPAMQRLAIHCPVTRRAMLKKMGAEAPEVANLSQDAEED